jgi:RNA polymerase sigma-70 factor, ECF subfamily
MDGESVGSPAALARAVSGHDFPDRKRLIAIECLAIMAAPDPIPVDLHKRDDVLKQAFQYRSALLTYAYVLVRDWAQAEDVVQEAFLIVTHKWEEARPEAGLFPWLRQIVHYKSLEALRARGREFTVDEQELMTAAEQALLEHFDETGALAHEQMRQALRSCMEKLDPSALRLLSGHYWRRQSCEMLAGEFRRSANAIRIWLHRLRTQLRDCMARKLKAL